MSNANMKRAVENMRSGTTVYISLVEVIVNAIQPCSGLIKLGTLTRDNIYQLLGVRMGQKRMNRQSR